MNKPIVLKISGHQIDDAEFLTSFAQVVATMQSPIVIVHGGGKEISKLQETFGIEPKYADGVRITDEQSLAIVTMVLCGSVNKRLVRYLLKQGIDAHGISGIDRGLIRAQKMPHPQIDMGFTGEVTSVQGEILLNMLIQGITPVVAPLSLGNDTHLNVNGDHVAGAIATAINAERVIFLSNVEGVLVDDVVTTELTSQKTEDLIQEGVIYGGMIPKVQTALHALQFGVSQAVITNLVGLQTHGGTVFTQ